MSGTELATRPMTTATPANATPSATYPRRSIHISLIFK
jgi:hypothetical protein